MRWFTPKKTVSAHCDLPCGVYDPAQAKIEAMSVLKSMEKYHDSDDHDFKARCLQIKEERADEVKHHLWVLWTDFFKPHHLEADGGIHELIWNATKAAGEAKKTTDPAKGQELIDLIDQISEKFWATAEGPGAGVYAP